MPFLPNMIVVSNELLVLMTGMPKMGHNGSPIPNLLDVLTLITAIVPPIVLGLGEDKLSNSGTRFERNIMVYLKQPFTSTFVSGIPDCCIEHAGVPEQRRPWIQKPDMVIRNPNQFIVTHNIAARR